jgi:hypothetical protein
MSSISQIKTILIYMLGSETGKSTGFLCGILSHDPLLGHPINQNSAALWLLTDIFYASAFAARQGKAEHDLFPCKCLLIPNGRQPRHSQRPSNAAAPIPAICAPIKAATPAGAMPAKVSESARAKVTAGLANDVEAVNQYAAVM